MGSFSGGGGNGVNRECGNEINGEVFQFREEYDGVGAGVDRKGRGRECVQSRPTNKV